MKNKTESVPRVQCSVLLEGNGWALYRRPCGPPIRKHAPWMLIPDDKLVNFPKTKSSK